VSATRAFASKELSEVVHTWRLWVLPGVLLFTGLTSPVLAAMLPRIAKYATGQNPGTVIKMATPTAYDAYVQFMGNLQQIAALTVVIIGGGIIAAEVRNGTAALTLAKPLSRVSYVLTKAGVLSLLTVAATVVGTAVCIAVTTAIFGAGDVGRLVAATATWLLLALFYVALSTLFSATVGSQLAAAVMGVGAVIAVGVLSGLTVLRDYTPAGLGSAGTDLLAGEPTPLLWPIATTAALTIACLLAAVWAFRRREL